jgi:putative phage-type endonuclease
MQAVIKAETRDMPRGEWLALRREGIGGSDAAAIIGLNEYCTPFRLWAEKTGRMGADPENERMRVGTYNEEYVARRFCEITGKKVRRRNAILQHPDYGWMFANIDRVVVGERAGLECKTTSVLSLKALKNGEFPEKYYAQCVHYLAVTGFDKWYLCVLVFGDDQPPRVYEIERDEAEIDALIRAEREFWEKYVVPDVAPPVDGMDATGEAVRAMFGGGDKEEIEIDVGNAAARLVELKAEKKALETLIDKAQQEIQMAMGDHEKATSGKYKISWASYFKASLNMDKLKAEHPKIDFGKYYDRKPQRRFEVKEAK